MPYKLIFTARRNYASVVLGVIILQSVCPSVCLFVCLSVCLSVRQSVTRVLCDKNKQCTADILIPHKRTITLVF